MKSLLHDAHWEDSVPTGDGWNSTIRAVDKRLESCMLAIADAPDNYEPWHVLFDVYTHLAVVRVLLARHAPVATPAESKSRKE